MMKMKKILLLFFLLSCFYVQAQQITTFILVRHAEKTAGGLSDPDLTDAGHLRATRLAAFLKETKIDAIYSTAFKRTTNTVMPLAKDKGLGLFSYDPLKTGPIDEMISKYPGGTIVVCGHSNTVPWTANYLIGKEEYKNFNDGDYDNILVVTITEKGKGKVVWLKY